MSMSWNLRFWNVNMHLCSVSFSKRVDVSRIHQTFLIENFRMKSCWTSLMYQSYRLTYDWNKLKSIVCIFQYIILFKLRIFPRTSKMTLLLPPKSFSYFATQQNDHIICYNNKRLLHSFNPSFHTIPFEYNTKKKIIKSSLLYFACLT